MTDTIQTPAEADAVKGNAAYAKAREYAREASRDLGRGQANARTMLTEALAALVSGVKSFNVAKKDFAADFGLDTKAKPLAFTLNSVKTQAEPEETAKRRSFYNVAMKDLAFADGELNCDAPEPDAQAYRDRVLSGLMTVGSFRATLGKVRAEAKKAADALEAANAKAAAALEAANAKAADALEAAAMDAPVEPVTLSDTIMLFAETLGETTVEQRAEAADALAMLYDMLATMARADADATAPVAANG